MMHTVRAFLKSWFATALLSILIIAFAVTGIYQYGGNRGALNHALISAGSRTVGDEVFKRSFERYRQQASQQSQQNVTLAMAVEHGLDRMVLEGMAAQEALADQIEAMGLRPSDHLVAQQIRSNTAFFNPINGQFDEAQYRRQIAEGGFVPETFETALRSEVAQTHFASAAQAGFRAPRSYAALDAAFALEARDASFVAIPASVVQPPPPPTDAQLTAFMNEHQAEMTRPEMRIISVVRFSSAALAPTMTVDAAAVEREFNFRRETLSTPERRTFVQIPLRNAGQGADVIARLNRGEDPTAVARAIGVEAIAYADRPRSAVTDTRIAAAAFSMASGQVSSVVQGDVGLAVLKVTSITPGHQATLADARAQIENALKAQAAEQRAYALSEAYDRARRAGANLTAAAAQSGIQAITLGPIAENGASMSGPPNPILTPQILATAFHDLSQGQESDVIEVGRGESYAVRVERVLPPAVPPLAEVRDIVARQYMMQAMARQLRERITAIQARIDHGESLEAIGASVHGQVGHVAGMSRATAQQEHGLGPSLLQAMFGARVGQSFIGEVQGGVAAGKVTAIRNGDITAIAQMTEGSRDQVSRALFNSVAEAAQRWATTHVRMHTDLDRARQVLGVTPEMIPAQTGAAAPASKAAERPK